MIALRKSICVIELWAKLAAFFTKHHFTWNDDGQQGYVNTFMGSRHFCLCRPLTLWKDIKIIFYNCIGIGTIYEYYILKYFIWSKRSEFHFLLTLKKWEHFHGPIKSSGPWLYSLWRRWACMTDELWWFRLWCVPGWIPH